MVTAIVPQLRRATEEAWQAGLFATQAWKALEGGNFGRAHYASYLRETFHYTRMSALIQASAIPHFRGDRRALVRPFLKHALEEEGHSELCRRDLDALGLPVAGMEHTAPLPATEGYVGFILARIAFVSPVAYFGYLYQLESLAVHVGPRASRFLDRSVGEAPVRRFLQVHASDDVTHVAELERLMVRAAFTPAEEHEVTYAARTAAALYGAMIESAYTHPWEVPADAA